MKKETQKEELIRLRLLVTKLEQLAQIQADQLENKDSTREFLFKKYKDVKTALAAEATAHGITRYKFEQLKNKMTYFNKQEENGKTEN